ncbi:MAG: pyrimidine-nucleoside phosphorylase [Candidatus Natronoplasma sp.]
MRMYDMIMKKRNGETLTEEEIEQFIQGYTAGEIPDYQASALLMAVYFQGMDDRETVDLTRAMVESGEQLDLPSIEGKKVDKHSTGGVGDTTTMVLAPLVAAAGVPVAKMSGRGLGHTGGTLDKLEAIPGFSVEMTIEEFVESVNDKKIAVAAQTADLAPADKKLYSLRDVTATVDEISLIASSIMSKKIAAGSDAIVLDVKIGSGAFMKEREEAVKLAESMVNIGKGTGRDTTAVISNMDQPLGKAVGNAMEVKEAIETLKGEGPEDLTELCLVLGSQMLVLAEEVDHRSEGKKVLEELLKDGTALKKFKEFVENQGGDPKVVSEPNLLPSADGQIEMTADKEGCVTGIDAEGVGMSALKLGAGRETKDAEIDLSVGIEVNKKVGDEVEEGESLATIHYSREKGSKKAEKRLKEAFEISADREEPEPLIYDVIR